MFFQRETAIFGAHVFAPQKLLASLAVDFCKIQNNVLIYFDNIRVFRYVPNSASETTAVGSVTTARHPHRPHGLDVLPHAATTGMYYDRSDSIPSFASNASVFRRS